jgi:predicted phage terminase large subunit-like protein
MDTQELTEYKAKLLGSPLLFTQVFFKLITGKDFVLSNPIGRESHFITIFKALKKVFDGEIKNLIIAIPPRYGKTISLVYFAAWAIARYGDCNFLYTSCEKGLATTQTQYIREIINHPLFYKLFGTQVTEDTRAKHNFHTDKGGSVYACGAGGTIIGRGAGIKNCNRYGGSILVDDIIDANDVLSETIRKDRNEWYLRSLEGRVNNAALTSKMVIGQRLHEDDLIANLIKQGGWTVISIPALDENNNALYPEEHTTEMLLKMKEHKKYVFAAQYQQTPLPAGDGIFKAEDFILLSEEPKIYSTFITIDTAETDKDYNDATVFSFWGLYKIKQPKFNVMTNGFLSETTEIETDLIGLHWIDCVELRVEPKDLLNNFMDFYAGCMRHKVKPKIAAIEKKSTGVTMSSILSGMQGLQILDIERTRASGNKTARFLEAQPYQASKRISFLRNARHAQMCISHCEKITANDAHRFDDIADTMYDAIKIGLIDEVVSRGTFSSHTQADDVVNILASHYKQLNTMQSRVYEQYRR